MVTEPTGVGVEPLSSAWFSLQPGQFHRRWYHRQPALPRPGALPSRLPRVAQVSADCELRSRYGRDACRSWGSPISVHGRGLRSPHRYFPRTPWGGLFFLLGVLFLLDFFDSVPTGGSMSSKILHALRGDTVISVADAVRHESNLCCPTCEGALIVKDGHGELAVKKGRRSGAKGKHFSHKPGSTCHGEGMVHYALKSCIRDVVESHLVRPFPSGMPFSYVCPDEEYSRHEMVKMAPQIPDPRQPFWLMKDGYHDFRLDNNLVRVVNEYRINKRSRADVVGLGAADRLLWVIEIKRTALSSRVRETAALNGVPTFVIDASHLPKSDDRLELGDWDGVSGQLSLVMDNLSRGYIPAAEQSFNTVCSRKEMGMGPDDHSGYQLRVPFHPGCDVCTMDSLFECEGCILVVLHQCSGEESFLCPDSDYMGALGIGELQMYLDPVHRQHSHKPDFIPVVPEGFPFS